MEIDDDQRIIGFEEKKPNPKTIPGDPEHCLASMGIYVFTARFLFEQLCRDATQPGSRHDFGRNIIPSLIDTHRVFAFPFRDENRKTRRLLARRGHARRLLRSQHGPDRRRSAAEPVRRALADPHATSPTSRRRSSCSPSTGPKPAAARRSTASSARARSSPAARWSGRSSARTSASTATRTSRIRSCSKASTSAGTPRFAARSSTRASTFRRASQIGYDPEHDRARGFTVSEGGHRRHRQGRRRRAFRDRNAGADLA